MKGHGATTRLLMIEDDPKHPRRIVTLRGAGYLFTPRQDEEP